MPQDGILGALHLQTNAQALTKPIWLRYTNFPAIWTNENQPRNTRSSRNLGQLWTHNAPYLRVRKGYFPKLDSWGRQIEVRAAPPLGYG